MTYTKYTQTSKLIRKYDKAGEGEHELIFQAGQCSVNGSCHLSHVSLLLDDTM